jgi:hypothetical protein
MKKEFLVAVLAIGFIFAGAISASAGTITWTMVETTSMARHSPGADGLIGQVNGIVSDGTTNCNYSDASSCATTGSPNTGAYGFSTLDFKQASSCAIAALPVLVGDACTTNDNCGPGVCVDCNTPSRVGTTYFAKNPTGGSRGLGTMTANACDNGFTYSNVSIGTSEVVGTSGGSCMTLTPSSPQSNSGCSGALNTLTSMDLWIEVPIIGTPCAFPAGQMPGLNLAGSVFAGGSTPASGTCGYTGPDVGAMMTDAGVGAGQYLFITCGTGTLPSNLQSACLRSADWTAMLVGKTSSAVPTVCGAACSTGGCMAGTAEGVE